MLNITPNNNTLYLIKLFQSTSTNTIFNQLFRQKQDTKYEYSTYSSPFLNLTKILLHFRGSCSDGYCLQYNIILLKPQILSVWYGLSVLYDISVWYSFSVWYILTVWYSSSVCQNKHYGMVHCMVQYISTVWYGMVWYCMLWYSISVC